MTASLLNTVRPELTPPLLTTHADVMSPSPNWEPYTDENGLPGAQITDETTDHQAILWEEDGQWKLWFADPVEHSYRQLELGEHPNERLAMTAAEGALEQANHSRLRSIDHYRLPIPHKRLQVARFNDGHKPTFYVYDHRIIDSLHDVDAKDMDCRLGRTPKQEQIDNYFASIGMPRIDQDLEHDRDEGYER